MKPFIPKGLRSRWRRRVTALLATLLVAAPALSCCCVLTGAEAHEHLEVVVTAHQDHGMLAATATELAAGVSGAMAHGVGHPATEGPGVMPAQGSEHAAAPCHDAAISGSASAQASATATEAAYGSADACTDDAPARQAVQAFDQLPVAFADLPRTPLALTPIVILAPPAALRSFDHLPAATPVTLKQVMRA